MTTVSPSLTILLLSALLSAGCASAVAVIAPAAGTAPSCVSPGPDRDVLVGVALSGGGSRAALFGASALEALGRMRAARGGSVLEQVSHLSSVSGGSVAAAYYASQKPPRGVPVLTAEGALSDDYQAFFARFRDAVTQDLEGALIRRQLSTFRWLNPSLAARSLFEVLSERLFGEINFQECDRQLLITAAAKVVALKEQEIQEFLAADPAGSGRRQEWVR